MRPAVLLDRDGTLNPDPGYINDPDDFHLFPGVPEALQRLQQAGFLLVLVTNQSGIARGLVTRENLDRIHLKLQDLLKPFGVGFAGIYYCPHHPQDDCDCRKPRPGMAVQAIRDFDIDCSRSFLVGDKKSDVQMAQSAGLMPIFIGAALPPGISGSAFPSLSEAADWMIAVKKE
jgi:D,D-heptose 1,7-bisphosphate phosphatase